mgnify:FL=1
MQYDVERILLEMESLPKWDLQICLQSYEGNHDHMFGCGLLKKIHDAGKLETDLTHKIFNIPYVNSIIDEYQLYRTKFFKMKPYQCYSYHRDQTKRLHIPIITNDKCFLVVDDEVVRTPVEGNFYVIDTTKIHTAVNASFKDRIHLIGCLPA